MVRLGLKLNHGAIILKPFSDDKEQCIVERRLSSRKKQPPVTEGDGGLLVVGRAVPLAP